jgi:hypothetical protein
MVSICQFCNNSFSNKYNLDKHLKSAKFCIKIQQERNYVNNSIEEFECNLCNKKYVNKVILTQHLTLCKEKSNKNKLESENIEKEQIIQDLKLENTILKEKLYLELKNIETINLLTEENAKLKSIIEDSITGNIIKLREEVAELRVYKSLYEEQEIKLEKSQRSYENLATKAIDKAGNNNKIYNKFIQNLIPLTDDHLKEQAKNLELKHVIDGPDSLAVFAKQNALKDRVICTDVTRRNFIFKDENGNIIKDPKGVKITKKFVDNNKDEIVRLLKAYVLTFYDDDTLMSLKEKQEMEELMFSIKYSNDPDNSDSYNNFERQFTVCFSKLVYNKQYESLEHE